MPKKQKHYRALIETRLVSKYCTGEQHQSLTNEVACRSIIQKIVQPHRYLNSTRINFDEIEILCKQKEYLKRQYKQHEYQSKICALAEYYKFHHNYPYHMGTAVGVIMMTHQDNKNKQHRRFIKKLMHEPESITGRSEESEQKSTNKSDENCQFSLKLKQIDMNQSSLFLGQFCRKIDQNFSHVGVPIIHGVHDNEANQFRQFLIRNSNLQSNHNKVNPVQFKRRLHSTERLIKINKDTIKISKNETNKQNQHKQDTYRQFKKLLNVFPQNGTILRKLPKKVSLSKLNRNKTVMVKPQSFSKTTVNETVSREEHSDQLNKKPSNCRIRLRKCRSTNKNLQILNKNKSTSRLIKQNIADLNSQKGDEKNSKISRFNKSLINKATNFLNKITITQQPRNINRIISQPKQRVIQKNTLNFLRPNQSNALQNMIKNKLKLRA